MALSKDEIMAKTLEAIRDKMPDEHIGKYQDLRDHLDVETLSTGSIAVDEALNGGWAVGRVNSIVGKASSGKSSMMFSTIACLQKRKPDAQILYIDAENALDPRYMKSLGVDLDKMYIVQPDNGEDAYDIAYMFISSGVADLVVLDSIPAMIPKAMLEYELDEQPKIAMGATLDTRGMSRLVTATKQYGGTVIAINQYKERVQVGMPTQGDGVSGNGYLVGGSSLPFMFSQILKIQRVGKIFEGDEVVGDQVRCWAIKNKIGAPYTTSDYFLSYGKGINLAEEVIMYGTEMGLIGKTARTFWVIDKDATDAARLEDPNAEEIIVEGSRQGSRPKFVEYLNNTPEVLDVLIEKVREEIRKRIAAKSGDTDAAKEAESMGVKD